MTRKYSVREYKRSDERAVREIEAQMIATLRRTYRPKPSLIASSDEQAGNRRKLVALDEGIPVGATDYVIQNGAVHFMAMGRRERLAHRRLAGDTGLTRSLGNRSSSAGAQNARIAT